MIRLISSVTSWSDRGPHWKCAVRLPLMVAILSLLPAAASAAPVNLSFETGDLSGWAVTNPLGANDFGDPWKQFHDELMTFDEAVEGDDSADDSQLSAILAAMGTKLLGERHEPHHRRYIHLPAHRFWHGNCQIGSRSVIFFYFEQDDLGLAGFCRSLTDPNIDLMRFSVLALPPGVMPVRTRGQA